MEENTITVYGVWSLLGLPIWNGSSPITNQARCTINDDRLACTWGKEGKEECLAYLVFG